MNCKVKQGCLTSESCCILLWLAFTLERGYNRCGRYIHYTVGKERIIDHFICWVPEENGSGKR